MDYLSLLGLKIFRYAVDLKTFRAAAEYMQISQPAVSAHIRRLEEYLGVELFERPYGRVLRPTEAGYILHNYAIETISKSKELEKNLHQISLGELGEVRVAVDISKHAFYSLCANFINAYPKIRLICKAGNALFVKKIVQQGDVDIGLSMYEDDPSLIYKPFYQEPLLLVCAPSHPLASKALINKKELSKYGFVACFEGTTYNFFLQSYLASLGIEKVKVIAEAEDGIAIRMFVEGGAGVGLLLRNIVESSLQQGHLISLSFNDGTKLPHMKGYLVFRKEVKFSKAVELFINFICTEFPKRFPYITLTADYDNLIT